ncbi:MAG: oligosaccharide flippase family protein [Anaerolineae bacterium]|nr:oligosaccharide flippase family protein [Anaerolineae bacterium]
MTKNRTRNYLLGVGTGYVATLASILIALWFAPFTLRYISAEAYGINSVIGSIVLWTQIATLGFPAWLSLYLAQHIDTISVEEINKHFSTVTALQIIAVVATFAVGVVVALNFTSLFEISPALQDQASLVAILVFLAVICGLIEQPFSMLLIAHQQMYYESLMQLLSLLIRTAVGVTLLLAGFNVISIALGIAVGAFIGMIFTIRRAYQLTPGLDFRLRSFSTERIGEILSLSFWWTVTYVAGILIESSDQIVAARVISLEAVTVMVLTGRTFTLSTSALHRLARAARPMLGQLIGQKDWERLEETYRQLFTLSTGVALAVSAALWAGNAIFTRAWVGEENYGGVWLGLAFALNLLVNTWVQPQISLLNSLMIARQQAVIRLVEAALNLTLSILLAQRFGIAGVILGTTLAAAFTSLLYLPYLVSRALKRPYLPFLAAKTIPILKAIIFIGPVSVAVQMIFQSVQGLVGASVVIGLSFVINMVILWFVTFDDAIRERILSVARRLQQAVRGRLAASA